MASAALGESSAGLRLSWSLLGWLGTLVAQLIYQHAVDQATVGVAATDGLNFEHFTPHVAGAGLAEVQFDLDGGFQGLHIVEDQREGQQATSDGHGAEDNSREGDP
jgi:hypothetical protein